MPSLRDIRHFEIVFQAKEKACRISDKVRTVIRYRLYYDFLRDIIQSPYRLAVTIYVQAIR